MRGLPARHIASTALCAAVLTGIGAPAALAADPAPEPLGATAPRTPLPAADALLDRIEGLGDLGGRLAPVHDLLAAVLTADNGTLTVVDAQRLGDAARDALAQLTVAPVAPPTGAQLLAPPQAASPLSGQQDADPVDDLLATTQKDLDGLLNATTSQDVTQILPAVTVLVDDLGTLVTGVLQDLAQPATPSTAPAPALQDPTATTPTTTTPTTTTLTTAPPAATTPTTTAPALATPVTVLPAVTVPGITVAGVTVPGVTLPELVLPDVAVPEPAVPEPAVAETTVPQTGSTADTLPSAVVPASPTAPQAF
ncbi:hypothetical protein GCM10010512_46940 [Streptomyces thermoviolaceus subsp. thermoviolaceus]|uniref:Secreted protein n=1 Tax=Streptomyces thermoviolaceus subsp. thermoviolaceus TaxID=66860 RepID=A0ABX0Z035_STRTL|nr:hypothetical protein [Streptomyces thermoviolaceus]NJP16711.1 hypothetical protein [Streptomyces thermoviolaceus subsp. thermoviolaceus]GHB10086.1 hypothetical protein GCM10010512_46940 [Streptomyces thermoviolaceus subsp. thermoviolaceus]